MTMTLNEMLDEIVAEVTIRYRFDEIDNLIPKPRTDEKRAAVLDGLAQLNAAPPETSISLESLFTDGADPRWRALLYLATAKNILHTLIFDYTANGFTQSIGEFNVENRLGDYRSLYDTINSELESRLTAFKESVTKVVRRVTPTNQSALRPYAGLVSLRRPTRY